MSFNSNENNQEESSYKDLLFDDVTFEEFFKNNFISLCAFCQYRFGFDLDLAKEIVHTGFIKLWEVRQSLDSNLSPRSYLYRTIINSSRDVLRHDKVRQQYVQFIQKTILDESSPNTFESVDFKQLRSDIDAAISELPEQMRRIFELSRFEGMKYAEIAAQLNLSIKTIETQMSRALAKLRERLSGYLSLYFILLISSLFLKK